MWGRIIGTGLGLVIGRLPGAVLGFGLGFWFDMQYGRQFAERGGFGRFFTEGGEEREATFFYALFSTMGHVAKAKGRVTPEDIAQAQRLMDEFGLQGDALEEARSAFREGKERTFALDATLKQFRRDHQGRRDLLQSFMELIVGLALNAGKLEKDAYAVLLRAAKTLGFTRFELDKWLLMHAARARFQNFRDERQTRHRPTLERDRLVAAYDLLGVKESISDEGLKKVHRKLMREHHPDKLAAQGLPEEMRASATAHAQEIQAAYDLIRTARRQKS
ncbi:MAG: co-chaperone DjlA [Idiomarina sp.]|nr:co-chaperone DjlA [Idiomarina sp.]